MDISEFLTTLDLPPNEPTGLKVAYQSACSLQHGQRVSERDLAEVAHTLVRVALRRLDAVELEEAAQLAH